MLAKYGLNNEVYDFEDWKIHYLKSHVHMIIEDVEDICSPSKCTNHFYSKTLHEVVDLGSLMN